MIKKKNSRTLGLYITYSFLNFDSSRWSNYQNIFVLKQESFFSFIYYIFINYLGAYCSRQLVLIIVFS